MTPQDIVTIYCEEHTLASDGGWGWPFYRQARETGLYRFETDISRLNSVNRIIFAGLSQKSAAFIQQHRPRFSLILPAFDPKFHMDGYADIYEQAEAVLCLGKPGAPFPHAVLPQVCAISDLPVEKDRSPFSYLPYQDPGRNLVILSPRNYLAIWDFMIAMRLTPETVTILTSSHAHIPLWFVETMRRHGIALRYESYSSGTLPLEFLESHAFYRDLGPLDYIDCLAFSAGVTPLTLGKNLFPTEEKREAVQPGAVITIPDILQNLAEEASRRANQRKEKAEESNLFALSSAQKAPLISIICHEPTYLFADLTKRFVAAGCVHSNLPLPEADAFIWLRPQEYVAFSECLKGKQPSDIPVKYQDLLKNCAEDYQGIPLSRIAEKSLAIHHGICPDPIYQFDPVKNALFMSTIRSVAGVCPFESCYRQVAHLASRKNFTFIPIGYDDRRFTADHIRKDPRKARTPLQLGFVGRAYGTYDRNLLDRSPTATPRGYIKGGDHLLNIALRLKARGVEFHLHIVGQNWEEHVEQFRSYGIAVTYHQRDQNIVYDDYPALFASFDALIITSRGESGPVPALEAMSVGVPVIGCDNAGMVKFLGETTQACHVFSYDTKWHVMDYDRAVAHLEKLYDRAVLPEERTDIRQRIAAHTTDAWISKIMEFTLQDRRINTDTGRLKAA